MKACNLNAAFPSLPWLDKSMDAARLFEATKKIKPGDFKSLFGVDKSGV